MTSSGQSKCSSSCCSGFIKLIKSFLCTGSLRIKSNTNGLGVPLIVIVLNPTALEDAVVDPWKIAQHFEANEGNITQEMNDSLVNAGIPQDTIDVYLEGSRAQRGFGTQGELTDADVSEIHNLAGGKAAYDNLTQWAGNNLPADDVKAFDDVVATGNKSALRFAVKALNAQYEDAVGREPSLVTGKTSMRGDKYRSMAEVVRDMESPQYESNDAYRLDVMQKLERSNLKV